MRLTALLLLLAALPACDASHAQTPPQDPAADAPGRYRLEVNPTSSSLYLVDTRTGEVYRHDKAHWTTMIAPVRAD